MNKPIDLSALNELLEGAVQSSITADGRLELFLHGTIALIAFVDSDDGQATVSLKLHPWPYVPLSPAEEKRRILSMASAPLSECSVRRGDAASASALLIGTTAHQLPRQIHVDLAEAWLARMRGRLQ